MCSKCSNKLSQLGAFLLLTALLSACGGGPGNPKPILGTSWTKRNPGTTNVLFGVTYGNGIFVAVGEWGIILTSP